MRIYAIVAHDRKNSLTQELFHSLLNYLTPKKNITLDILDLYDRANDIPFYWSDFEKLSSYPFFQENKERFMKADRLIIAFPVYWYSTPGILKCWIDLITKFAWDYEQGFYAKPLHSIRKTLVISTTMSPSWYNRYILGNPAHHQLKYTFKWMGIFDQLFYEIGNTKQLTDKKFSEHIKNIYTLGDKLLEKHPY